MTTPQQTRLKHALSRSTWVTGGWNWLLTLVSRAAEAILTVTILYSTLQIFTDTNPQVDLGMFLAQQIALDAGGIGLVKMANQAKRDGQPESARKARTVALILMILMGIGVVISEIESKLTLTQTMRIDQHLVTTTLDFRHAYPGVALLIEILLLVARGAMAIVYGFTIHDLESALPEAEGPVPTNEMEEMVGRLVGEHVAVFQEYLSTAYQEWEQLKVEHQRLQTMCEEAVAHRPSPFSHTDEDALINTVVERVSDLFATQYTPSTQTFAQTQTSHAEAGHTRVVEDSTHQQPDHTPTQNQTRRPKRIDPAMVDAVVHPLLNGDPSLTHRKIAALPTIVYTETVVYASVKRWRNTRLGIHPPSGDASDSHTGAV